MKDNITMSDVDLDMSGDVRSPAGHAAFSMRGTDDRWVKIQLNTFKNWLNDQLRDTDIFVEDLHGDLCDGIKLCILLEVLQGHKIGRIIKKPFNQHHYLENVNLALRAMTNDNIKLVNIGSEDIVNGNRKLTMALIWHLILRYQIGKSKVPAKKLMLSWIQAVLPDLGITNFSTDWNDGIALQALVEHCRPGTCPDWRNISRKDGLNNCKEAMSLAKQHFGIPLVLSPENLSSPDLDELSGMTYLSYFMKVDSPGYDVTLNWVHEQIPQEDVQDFQTDWNDGSALTALVRKLGGDVPDMTSSNHEDIIETAMEAAQRLGVEPVISAKEMADPEVDHLGVMAYAAWFQHLSKLPERQPRVEEIIPVRSLPPPLPPSPPPEPPKPAVPPQDQLNVLWRRQDVYINRPVSVSLEVQDDDLDLEDVKIEVIGPQGSQPQATVTWKDSRGRVEFTPQHVGPHKVVVYNKDTVVHGAPLAMEAKLDLSSVRLASSLNTPSYTGKATSLKINAKDAQRGAVKVEARAPSGRVHEMSVADANGVYTANFTPTEVGDWQVAIKYEGQHIQGSPFSVRVYDAAQVKVYGLEGGAVGKTFSFNVDTIGAGEGDLTINIVHNGRTIPANIIRDQNQPGKFRANFTPDGSGVYSIRVYFAGIEVTGSPYTLEIVDSSQVTAAGVGLTTVEINRKAEFLVNTGQSSGSGDLRVEVTGPHGSKIPATVRNNNDGTHTVEYVPSDVGEYVIDVYFYGRHIKGSPFKAQAFDWSRISVTNLRDTGMVGKTVEFDIDAASAGSGNLEIMVNDGTIPCSVQNRGNRQFHASFLPKEAKPHFIQMRFNGREVPGSPWRIEILSAANVSTSGKGLQLVPINTPSVFEVRTGNYSYSGNINVQITAPSGRVVPSNITSVGGGNFTAEYVPVEVGSYAINVSYEGMAVPGSPFTAKAYNADAIVVSSIPNGMIGKPVDFTIDVMQAGEGQLEIMVNRGGVPNTVKMIRKGVFQVSFTPRDINPHTIDIKFNGELLRYSPINVPIMDTSRITVQGEGLRQVAVNRQSFFRVNTQRAGDADLAVRVTSPKGSPVAASVIGSGSSGFDVDFRPSEIGTYKVEMEYGGASVPGCPYYIKVYDPSKVKVREVGDGIVGVKTGFLVDIDDSGEGSLEISISGPSGTNLQNTVHQLGPGRFEVSYIPMENGPHKANILFNKQHVPGSPFSFTVIDASKVTATGEGLGLVPCNRATGFSVYAPGAHPEDLNISIIGPDGRNVLARIYDGGRGSHNFTVEYTPVVAGEHKIEIRYFGQVVPGSPFVTKAWDASKVIVSDLATGRIGKPSQFYIDASRAGAGNLEIVVSCGGENVPNFVKAEGNARFLVSFTPNSIDTHTIQVKFNGESVPGCPIIWSPEDVGRTLALGDGPIRVPAGQPAVVLVDPRRLGAIIENAVVEVTSPSDRVLRAHVSKATGKQNASLLKAEFTPREVGTHTIQVTVGTMEIQGSPFTCEVYNLNKVKVTYNHSGIVGQPYEMEVDTTKAGLGSLEAVIKLDARHRVPCKLIDKSPGIYKVTFLPRDPYRHLVFLLFSREPLPGSPFAVDVEDSTMVYVTGSDIEMTPIGQKAGFEIDPRSALFKADVKVRITGPPPVKEDIPFFLQGSYHEGWTVEWRPLALGVYTIDVLYGDRPLVGSPFKCKVYDLSKVRIIRERQTRGTEGILGDVVFYVDASEAGAGNLEVVVRNRRDGTRIPNFLESEGHTGRFRVYFTPQPYCYNYQVDVTFNNEQVFGSPFYHAIIDGSRATASGPGLKAVPANKPTYFDVFTQGVSGEAPLEVEITAPSGRNVPSRSSGTSQNGFRVEYVPIEVGPHKIQVHYADVDIQGSPFSVDVFDAGKVKVGDIPEGVLGQPVKFDIDTSSAGNGQLSVEVRGQSTSPHCDVTPRKAGRYEVIFVPREVAAHYVHVLFNGEKIPGSPFAANVFDWNNITVNWEAARVASVNKVVTLTLDPKGAPDAPVEAKVTDPYGQEVATQVNRHGSQYHILFTPVTVGPHTLVLMYGGQGLSGSPGTCNAYDASRVRLADVIQPGIINKEMGFTVDTSEAGFGDLDIEVFAKGGIPVNIHRSQLDQFRHRVTFVPGIASDHIAEVSFNYERIPGIPLVMNVFDWNNISVNWERARLVPVNKAVCVDLDPCGAPEAPVETRVIDPSGKELPTNVMRNGHIYQIMLTPTVIGPHTMTITYGGQVVQGSPFTLNAYDTARVRVHDVSTLGALRQEMGLTVDTTEAGMGDVEVEVKCQDRLLITKETAIGHHSRRHAFVPTVAEMHQVLVTFNKQQVPGSPFPMKVFDPNRLKVIWDAVRPVPLNRPATFTLDPCGAPPADVTCTVLDPNNRELVATVSRDATLYKATFTPMTLGAHKVTFTYGGQIVPGSPFICLTFDPNLVLVTDVTEQCILGQEVEFTVDVSTSGYKGEILVEVTCEGDTVPIRYFPLDFNRRKFTFSPLKAAIHEIDVCLNEVRPPGIPFSVRVIDFGQLVVDYEAARSVPLGSLGIIYIDPRGFPNPDVESRVTDSQGLDLPVVIQQEEGKYRVEFNPQLPDTYTVTLTFCGQPVPGSPHKCHVYDAEKVKVIDMKNNCSLGEEMSFWVDLGEVGEGELTLQVLARGENVPIRHQPLSKFRHQFMFVPQSTTNHEVHILFNKDKLPRSPYIVRVFDVKDVAMNFDAMRPVPVNKLVTMEIDARGLPESRVDVTVQDPLRNQIQPRVYNEGPVHKIEFTPVMVGVHTVSVQYGGQPVPGSPFLCNAYDTGRVIIQQVPSSVLVGQDTSFTVDVRDAGQGVLGAEVYHEGALVPFQHQRIDQVTHRFSVTPTEPGNHEVRLHFNGETVLGTPFNINAYNMNKMAVNTEAARLVPVNLPITVELDPRGVPDAKVEVRVTDTQGHEVPAQLTKNQSIFLVEFVPRAVGLYMMDLRCAGHPVPGSPFQCQAYDASRIQITDVTQQGMVREEMGFTVSTQGSGQGEVQAEVVFSGAQQQLTQRRLDQFRTRYSFVPTTPGDHLATVKFNKTIVPNTPFVLSVMDPSVRMYVRTDPAMQTIATGSTGASYVQSQGGARINIKDVTVRVIAPNGELVAAKIVQQPDGDYKVEYSSRYTGRHTVEILYAGQAIMGSPFFVEIYDPNKIKVEGTRSGVVGQRMEIDILNNEAGRAELGLTINSPSGRNVPYDIAPTAVGERVSYVPIEAGPHQIYITYGGLEVPGTPITQAIVDAGTAGVYGDGIKFAHEDQPAQFYVDTQGRKGNLVVQVEGPNSISKVNVEPDPAGKFLVTYVPVEVGIYNVMVKWNGKPVEGSPFHPRVVDARKVRPIGGWEAILDSQERMHLKIAQRNRVEFDTTMAGPGEMRAEVKGPDGPVPADVEGGNGKYAISFIPRVQGDYYIKVFWCEMCLPRCPVYAVAGPDAPIAPPVNHDKVVLSGHGLLEARVREEAEFVIDGNEAGPGTPEVRLSGVKSDIDVRLIPIGGNKYKAVYMPQIAGAYLLSIMWSDRQVRGSPYKVNVLPSSDASKVSVSGEGIRGGVFGKEIKAIIDTRRAGPGELTAHCMGPQKVAYCELYDHRDGTFTLNIKPQEAGKHLLQVKYGGEHVPGSPFILRVAGAPDASKVRVKGPGIEHGILADYQSRFICETRGAGAGQLTVRIRGPKGAFRVEMSRESQKDRTILCRYDPTEVGDYIISVKWSEEHVPGSPFHVQIFDTRNELERFLQNNPDRRKNAPALADEPWSDHF